MAFTVKQLIIALEEQAPDDAVVFIEFGNYVRAADKLSLVQTPELMVLAIQARDEEAVDKKDVH